LMQKLCNVDRKEVVQTAEVYYKLVLLYIWSS
jgi:hypothetical protein